MPNQTASLYHVHMPKTGGTSVHCAFNAHAGVPSRVHGGHDPAWMHPSDLARRRVVGTVRDPWSWYCSLYEHAMNNNVGQRALLSEWGGGSQAFRDVVHGWTGHRQGPRKRPGVIWETVGDSQPAAHEGLWSYAVRYFYQSAPGSWLTDCLLDTAQLDAGLRLLGVEPVERKNTRNHRGAGRFRMPDDERGRWDAEMLRWVERGDGTLSRELGYMRPMHPRDGGPLYGCAPAQQEAA